MSGLLLALALLLIAGNGFFVGAEFAILASRQSRLEPLRAKSMAARTALRATEQLPLMISGCQFGITLCSLGLGALGEPAVAKLLVGPFAAVGLPEQLVHLVALTVALTLISALHMLLGEMVPKNVALAGPERAALILAPPLVGFVRLFRPLIVSLTAVSTAVLRLLRIQPANEVGDAFTRESVASLIAESHSEGLLDRDQHELVHGAFALEERPASAITLALDTLVTAPPDVTPAEVEELVARTGYSRFPIRGPEISHTHDRSGPSTAAPLLLGYIHIADALETDPVRRDRPIHSGSIRPLATVAATDPLNAVLTAMQRVGAHLGQVVDAEGATIGVVALEDLLEELVGEVRDATQRRS